MSFVTLEAKQHVMLQSPGPSRQPLQKLPSAPIEGLVTVLDPACEMLIFSIIRHRHEAVLKHRCGCSTLTCGSADKQKTDVFSPGSPGSQIVAVPNIFYVSTSLLANLSWILFATLSSSQSGWLGLEAACSSASPLDRNRLSRIAVMLGMQLECDGHEL